MTFSPSEITSTQAAMTTSIVPKTLLTRQPGPVQPRDSIIQHFTLLPGQYRQTLARLAITETPLPREV
jgi:hypothetical protein